MYIISSTKGGYIKEHDRGDRCPFTPQVPKRVCFDNLLCGRYLNGRYLYHYSEIAFTKCFGQILENNTELAIRRRRRLGVSLLLGAP